ncbi:Esterase FE4 [Papilio xuthus]|uniref:Esterase FE4 n=1 Tax=Papilio xuthus TaxID=66420 RepID=A0A194PSE5_PAPXU|nr:Esterase FE4 [Papilio xuthus]
MFKINVKEGFLEGEFTESELGGKYYSFKGIPYAEPPIGDLRFKAPVPKKPWDGIRNAKEFGSICYQFEIKNEGGLIRIGSEDCLYLNVYTPEIKPKHPLPVMFYIHGGGLTIGSGNDSMYGPEFLVRHGVVLVTINYRLEVLGFLCLDTEEVPGNAGMKDQVMALKWVNDNIANFGGDPKNITIFGNSYGAISVNFHLISPMSKGLFQRAIIQSGSLTCPFVRIIQPRERAIALARRLGFRSEGDKELYEFFKRQPKESLIKITFPITYYEQGKEQYDTLFGIVEEKEFANNESFISGDYVEKLRNGIHEGIEIIMGYTDDEGLICLRSRKIEKTFEYANEFLQFYVPNAIAHNCTLDKQFEVGRRVKDYYFGNETITTKNLKKLMTFFSLNYFTYPMFQLVKSCSRKNKVYFYKFTGKTERNIMSRILKLEYLIDNEILTCHCDELTYIFPMKKENLKIEKQSKSYKIIENITKLWTDFAKHGNPTSSFGFEWTPYNSDEQAYLEINEQLTMGIEPDKMEVDFWENIYREYLPSSIPY